MQQSSNVHLVLLVQLDTALYKRGGKKGKGKGKKGMSASGTMSGMAQHEMLTPRQDMEQVDEEAEGEQGQDDAVRARLRHDGA